MKKKLLVSTFLSLFLVFVLISVLGSGCNTRTVGDTDPSGSSSTDTSWEPRVSSLERRMGAAEAPLVGLPEDVTIMSILNQILDDYDALTGETGEIDHIWAAISDLSDRLDDLEEPPEDVDPGNPLPPTSGEVVVSIVESDPLEFFSNETGSSPTQFMVSIANGTDTYQYVSYSVNMTCVTGDHVANIIQNGTPQLAISSIAFGAQGYAFLTTIIPDDGDPATADNQQVLFIPDATTPRVFVPPGETVFLYNFLALKTVGVEIEIWELTLTSIITSEH